MLGFHIGASPTKQWIQFHPLSCARSNNHTLDLQEKILKDTSDNRFPHRSLLSLSERDPISARSQNFPDGLFLAHKFRKPS
jgi:hypothetical protein